MTIDLATIVRTCPLCQAASSKVRREVDGWALATCDSCGFLYAPTIRVDTSDEQHLPEDYQPRWRARHHQIHRLLTRLVPEGSTVVDVGAGFGVLGLVAAKDRTFAYVGFEPAGSSVNYASRQGVDLRHEMFDRNSLASPPDAVVLDNVIEHVADPIGLLRECAAALRPGGILAVIVPNRWDVRQILPRWRRSNHWIPPQHINYFTSKEISRCLTNLGLSVRPFGFKALGRNDWTYWPRAALELVGLYPFGLNVYGTVPNSDGRRPERRRRLAMSAPVGLKHRLTTPEMQLRFKRWFDAAPIYTGPVTANARGWQVVRTRAKNWAISMRRALHSDDADAELAAALDRDGIVVIPDFLGQDEFEQVVTAYEAYASSPRVRDIGPENGAGIQYFNGPVLSDRAGDSAAVINGVLARHPVMITLAEHVIGRRVRPPLRIIFQLLASGDSADDLDREQILHADKAYPCVKAIYTIDDITEENSPFVYAKGSHRIFPERLRYERAMGLREAFLRRGRPAEANRDDGIELQRGRHVMTAETMRRLGVVETPMTCPANSLIITNNAGFHRRGRLCAGATRRTLWVNFYPYQRPWYGKIAHRLAKSLIDTDRVTRAPAAINQQQAPR